MKLFDMAKIIRSKNAGPLFITLIWVLCWIDWALPCEQVIIVQSL